MNEPIFGYIVVGCISGLVGSMVGLGGGIVMVPALTMLYGVGIKTAISASLVAMIATSAMASSVFAKKNLINFKLGLVLTTTTVLGSFLGSFAAMYLRGQVLMALFASLMVAAAIGMIYRISRPQSEAVDWTDEVPDIGWPLTRIGGTYTLDGSVRYYTVRRVPLNIGLASFAGCISGMLGVGGGIVAVPIMNVIGKVPVKVASATSSFMIGFTGLAGALIYLIHGQITLSITASMVVGIMIGAYVGSKLAVRIHSNIISWLFIAALLITASRMFSNI